MARRRRKYITELCVSGEWSLVDFGGVDEYLNPLYRRCARQSPSLSPQPTILTPYTRRAERNSPKRRIKRDHEISHDNGIKDRSKGSGYEFVSGDSDAYKE